MREPLGTMGRHTCGNLGTLIYVNVLISPKRVRPHTNNPYEGGRSYNINNHIP